MRRAAELEERPAQPALEWLRTVLWPEAAEVGVRRSTRRDALERSWWILPGVDVPRLLVPTAGAPAAVALRQFNDSMSQAARLKKAAAGLALRMPAIGRRRVATFVIRDGRRDDLTGSVLPALFGVPSVETAISIGRDLRPNLKPVIQVLSREGRVLGYVKVGWNDVTRALLDNEARVLAAWAASPPHSFRVPEVIHAGSWNGLQLLAVSPVPHPLVRRGRRNASPPHDVLAEIAALGGVRTAPLADASHARRLADRFGAIARPLEASVRTAMDALIAPGGPSVPLGTWHGDWAPWNMSTTSRSLFVWDWERSADDVPIGLDAYHFAFEVAYHKGGSRPDAAAATAAERTRLALDAMGTPGDLEVLERLYLLERLARIEEGRAANVSIDERLRGWIVERLGAVA